MNPAPTPPSCSELRRASGAHLLVDEILRLGFVVDSVAKRLSGFVGKDGLVKFDWLAQFAAHAAANPANAGLYCPPTSTRMH